MQFTSISEDWIYTPKASKNRLPTHKSEEPYFLQLVHRDTNMKDHISLTQSVSLFFGRSGLSARLKRPTLHRCGFCTAVVLLALVVTVPAAGQLVWTTPAGSQSPSVAFSPDGTRLASGSLGGTVRLWDVATGDELRWFTGHTDDVHSVAFSPDGTRLASGSNDGTVRLWDVATGNELRRFTGHTDWVNSVAFSPDGTRLASGSWDETVRLWDVATGDELRRFEGHTSYVLSVAFSPDGTRLASGSLDDTVRLWDVATGDEVRRFYHGSLVWVNSVTFSPDGMHLASGLNDDTVRLWDVATGDELRRFTGHTSIVGSVAFSPDGTRLASGSLDHTVRLWDVASPVGVAEANALPATIMLKQNYPNPFNPTTTIRFELPEPAHVRLHIFDTLGRHVTTLVDRFETAGRHEVRLRAAGLASGSYFYQLRTGTTQTTRRMQLMK